MVRDKAIEIYRPYHSFHGYPSDLRNEGPNSKVRIIQPNRIGQSLVKTAKSKRREI